MRGFAHVLVAPEYKQGLPFAIQGLGFGGLEPNTVLLGWPRRNHAGFDDDAEEDADDARAEEAAETLVATVCECTAAEKAVLLCLDPHAFPGSDERVSGFVDVWWVVHDGGLLLMIAHLLLRHRAWERCRLRVHTVLQKAQDPGAVRRSLQAVLRDFRIDAEVSVVEAGDDADMYAYTHDGRCGRKQASSSYRLLQAQARGIRGENPRRALLPDRLWRPTRGGNPRNGTRAARPRRRTPGRARRRGRREPGERPARRVAQGGARRKASSMKRAFPVAGDRHARRARGRGGGRDHGHQTSAAEQSMAPGDANLMAQGHAEPRGSIFDMAAVATKPEEKAGTKESETNGGSLSPIPDAHGRSARVRVRDEEDGEPSGVKSDEVRVAIGDSGDGGSETAPPAAEILSPKPRTKKAVSFGAEDVTRTYSPRPLTPVVPEATTSWVTDASSAEALNRIIREKSGDARLVIVNLPDPDAIVMANPTAYAKYTEQIVDGLERSHLRARDGREVYTSQ